MKTAVRKSSLKELCYYVSGLDFSQKQLRPACHAFYQANTPLPSQFLSNCPAYKDFSSSFLFFRKGQTTTTKTEKVLQNHR